MNPDDRETMRYVLGNVDQARDALERAQSALAVAVAYGRIRLNRDDGDETVDD
ncbi:MAG: hypothetical protein ACRDQD_08995 [Nocardioidaceae bacterium]